ncbi:MAG: FliM/FliN family flagellar motor switch protein [Moritella sp.]|uniref:FliM/FliN family flagellar motor C-terminal domain-containing protein n=1 Tax=Moritella sp. TaxID=78556 RepID=UPI001D6360A4|nr:FliM/FliN family flagellar motor C-terminal domain-containing protein [Moritella sp.]NQZ51685.1 FliM/FliN family flagellar motor switch protein [Moritella sp.]
MLVVKPTAVSPKATKSSCKITLAAESAEIEKYDLLGERRQWTDCLEVINSDLSLAHREIERRLSQLFNEYEYRITLQKFTHEKVNPVDLDTNIIWLQAQNNAGLKVLLSINNTMLYTLTEIFLGATKPSNKDNLEQPSDSEYRLLKRILSIQLNALDIQLSHPQEWTISHTNQPTKGSEFISSTINCTIKEYISSWQIWYPKAFINQTLSSNRTMPDYELLAAKLAKAATNIPTNINVILAKTQLNIEQLTQLKSGDFIMMDLPEIVSACTGNHVIAHGRVVVQSGRLVMQVTDTND